MPWKHEVVSWRISREGDDKVVGCKEAKVEHNEDLVNLSTSDPYRVLSAQTELPIMKFDAMSTNIVGNWTMEAHVIFRSPMRIYNNENGTGKMTLDE